MSAMSSLRPAVELGECLSALCGQTEPVLPPVRRQRLAGDQPVVVEILDDPAEVARIKTKSDPDLLGGRIFLG